MKPKKSPIKEEKDGQITKLKNRIRRLEKDNKNLKTEIKTLEKYRELTNDYIGGKLNEVPVEKVIRGIEAGHKLPVNYSIKRCCPICITLELKEVKHPAGVIVVCSNCKYREIIKE